MDGRCPVRVRTRAGDVYGQNFVDLYTVSPSSETLEFDIVGACLSDGV